MSIARTVISEAMKASFPATRVVNIDPTNIDESALMRTIVPALQSGEVVAFPTETVYGLGGNALCASAISKIFKAKGRPSDNPLIVHISNLDQLNRLVAPGAFPLPGTLTRTLCDRFWPGPLTILFPKNERVPTNVTAGLDQIAIRMPAHPIARKIIDLCDLPLAAPSANRSGKPSPTCASHVLFDLGRATEVQPDAENSFKFGEGTGIGFLVDGGECSVGVESTVVRVEDFKILRPGTVTLEQLKAIDSRFQLLSVVQKQFTDKKDLSKEEEKDLAAPATPGLKYKHYSPSVPVYLFNYQDNLEVLQSNINSFIENKLQIGTKVGILNIHKELRYPQSDQLMLCDIGDSPSAVAKNLFAAFRYFDEQGVDMIIMEGISEENEGMAVMNRARKAATEIL